MRRMDPWITGFLVVACAALIITSVGTFEFFDYILPWELALAATIVLALGIPLLKFAAAFDRRHAGQYLWTLAAFLLIELFAQYFKAQASFTPTIEQAGHLARSDLAWWARDWTLSRLLAFGFLATMPFAVVVMCHRAAERLVRVQRGGRLLIAAQRRANTAEQDTQAAIAAREAAEQRANGLEQARTLAEQEAERLRTLAEQQRERAEQAEREIEQLRSAPARPALTDEQDALVAIGGRSYSLRKVARAFDVAPSTAASRLLALDE